MSRVLEDALSRERILDLLSAAPSAESSLLADLEVLHTVDSTNSRLLRRAGRTGGIHRHVVIADDQSAGRGNTGRCWHSARGSGMLLSLGWEKRLPDASAQLLSLLVGVAVLGVAQRYAMQCISLKWQNDILVGRAKLGGILIERCHRAGHTDAWVIGVGVNTRLPMQMRDKLPYPVIDLCEICSTSSNPSRNVLIADSIKQIFTLLESLAEGSRADADLAQWRARDAYLGKHVEIETSSGIRWRGRSAGIGDDGGLRLWDGQCLRAFASGTLRLQR